MARRIRAGAAMVLFILSAFAAGLVLEPRLGLPRLYQHFVHHWRHQPGDGQKLPADGVFDTVRQTDFRALNQVRTPADVEARRRALAAFIWRQQPSPFGRMPDEVVRHLVFPPLLNLEGLDHVDRLSVRMELGVTSEVYLLASSHPGSCLMVYQEGHRETFTARTRLLQRFLGSGCDVLGLSLPLTGESNSRPLVDHPRFGKILLNNPDKLEVLETERFSTIQYFLTPVIVGLNHALAQRHYDKVGMMGFSGGGWVTELVSALDPRIGRSYAVAGSAPLVVHAADPAWGSYEQRLARLYEIATYEELYTMAAAGPGRRHVQYFNAEDTCCFAGRNWTAYRDAVAERAASLGGRFEVRDYGPRPGHLISKQVAVDVVRDFTDGE